MCPHYPPASLVWSSVFCLFFAFPCCLPVSLPQSSTTLLEEELPVLLCVHVCSGQAVFLLLWELESSPAENGTARVLLLLLFCWKVSNRCKGKSTGRHRPFIDDLGWMLADRMSANYCLCCCCRLAQLANSEQPGWIGSNCSTDTAWLKHWSKRASARDCMWRKRCELVFFCTAAALE